jgi:hypothetical protein
VSDTNTYNYIKLCHFLKLLFMSMCQCRVYCLKLCLCFIRHNRFNVVCMYIWIPTFRLFFFSLLISKPLNSLFELWFGQVTSPILFLHEEQLLIIGTPNMKLYDYDVSTFVGIIYLDFYILVCVV